MPRRPVSAEEIRARAGELTEVRLRDRRVNDGLITEELTFRSTSGLSLEGLLQRPEGAPGPLPAIVLLGGYDRGRRVVEAIPKDRHPVIWVSFDYPYRIPESARRFPGPIREVPRIHDALLNSAAGLVLVHEALEARGDVDPERVVVAGASLGGYLAVLGGMAEPGFDGVVTLFAGGDLERILERWIKVRSRTVARGLAASLLPWLGPLDPLHFVAAIAPRPFLMVNGRQDRVIPRESVDALYEAAGEPRRLRWIDAGHRVLLEPEGLRETTDILYEWMAESDLLAPAGSLP